MNNIKFTQIAATLDKVFQAIKKGPAPQIIHITGSELNKMLGTDRYIIGQWYEMTEEGVKELDV